MHRVNCRSFQSVTIWNTKICKLASTTIYSRVYEIKILLKSRGVINQRRNERGIPSSIEWHSFFFPPFIHVNRGTERKRRRVSGWTSTTSRSEWYGWNFRNIGRNIPIPRIIASLSCKPALRSRFGDRLYARFAFCIQKACRATWHLLRGPLPPLSKYSQYLNLPPSRVAIVLVELRIIVSIHPSARNFYVRREKNREKEKAKQRNSKVERSR